MRRSSTLATLAGALALAVPAVAAADALVTTGSPQGARTFPENKQNEPGLALDASNPGSLAAGSNDELDLALCDGADCPFTPGVGVSGVYFSLDGTAASWTQPTYQGNTGRGQVGGLPHLGPIGTLPNYYENGLASDGDPTLAFGPRPDRRGGFSWSNGSRLYYANLTANLATVRREQIFRGFEAIALSHTDRPDLAAANDQGAWSAPVVVSAARQRKRTFSDKETVWADNAASSRHFGNVYVCYTDFTNGDSATAPEPIVVSRSTDGGTSFRRPVKVSKGRIIKGTAGRQGCTVRTDSAGRVYVFYEDSLRSGSFQFLSRSDNGGRTFEKGHPILPVTDVGLPDPASGGAVFDGYAGARTDSFPSVDIANGAPSGRGEPDTIAITWSNGPTTVGGSTEQALLAFSRDAGSSWSTPRNVAAAGDRPDFPAVALAPNGSRAYVAYDAFTAPFQRTTAAPRPMQGVVRRGTVSGAFTTVHRGASGDARASSANALDSEFIGDYNWAAATNDGATTVFNDVRNGDHCPAVDAYRQGLIDGGTPTKPAPNAVCPGRFGNTDIYSQHVTP